MRPSLRASGCATFAVLALTNSGCEKLFQKDSERVITAGDTKAAAGEYRVAIKLYEASLDGTDRTADVHYKLATIYDNKLNDPLNALHHFNRYLELAPSGSHASEAKAYQKQGTLRLAETLNLGPLMTRDEAVRLKADNHKLNLDIAALRAQRSAPSTAPGPGGKGDPVPKPIPSGARTYVVQSGDTLSSIAGKVYKNKARWKEIRDANFHGATGTPKIKTGQKLAIP